MSTTTILELKSFVNYSLDLCKDETKVSMKRGVYLIFNIIQIKLKEVEYKSLILLIISKRIIIIYTQNTNFYKSSNNSIENIS